MNKQELIEKYEYELKLLRLQFGETLRTKVYEELLDYLKQLDEPQKVTVPQFVADYIEYAKEVGWDLLKAMKNVPYEDNAEFRKWFYKGGNVEVFSRAWLDGQEVEKEKRYLVKMKGMASNFRFLKYNLVTENYYMGNDGEIQHARLYHTREELESIGFGWVFDCPGVEIEEVKE